MNNPKLLEELKQRNDSRNYRPRRMSKQYEVFFCYGKNKTYRESGAYSASGTSYLDAVRNFVTSWNRAITFGPMSMSFQRSRRRRRGMPRRHLYARNDEGQRLLLVQEPDRTKTISCSR